MILDPISLYCERTGPGPLMEPLSLLASLAFLPVAVQIAGWSRDLTQLRWMAAMTLLLMPIALILHSYPSQVMLIAYLLPVLVLIMGYFFMVNRDILRMSVGMAAICTALILPFAAVSLPLVALLRGAASTAAYAAVPVLLMGYATLLRHDRPDTARGFFAAGVIMILAMVARAADLPLCDRWPYGTHFLWILGVAALLWQLARVYRRHMLAGQGRGG